MPNLTVSRRAVVGELIVAAATVALSRRLLAEGTQDVPSRSPSLVRARFDGVTNFSGWRHLDVKIGSRPCVIVSVGGLSLAAVVDSGAGRTVLDWNVALKLGLVPHSGFRAGGFTGETEGGLVDGLSIRIGTLTLSGITAAVLDLATIAAATGEPTGLILGSELFEQVIVDLDFPHERIGLFGPSGPRSPTGATRLPLQNDGLERRNIPIQVGGERPIQALFDLGSDAPLYLSPQYVVDHRLLEGRKVSTVAGAGVEGITVSQIAVLPEIRLGNMVVRDVPVEVPPTWNQPSPAVVGSPVLGRFEIVTDYSRGALWLTADATASQSPFIKDRSGIGAQRLADRLRVIHVARGSPAELVGLRIGDEIVAIDGHPIEPAYLLVHPRPGAGPAGKTLELTLSDGRRLKLTLADYF